MTRTSRRLLIAVLGLATTLGAVLAASPLVTWAPIENRIAGLLSSRLGREVRFDDLAIELALSPSVRIRGLSVENAAWGTAPHLVTVEEVAVSIDLIALLQGEIVLPAVVAHRPRGWLERAEDGRANWARGAAAAGTGGGESEVPFIVRDLQVDGAELSFDDRASEVRLSAQLASITGEMPERSKVGLALSGSLSGPPFDVRRVEGWVEVELGGEQPMVRADLTAAVLRRVEIAPTTAPREAGGGEGLLPSAALPSDLLRAADADVHLRVERTELGVGPLGAVDARVVVRDGRAEVRPLQIALGGGTIRGEITLDARDRPPSANADLAYEALPIKALFRGTRFEKETSGRLRGRLDLRGSGGTLDELVGTLSGHIALVMEDGTLSGLALEAAALDVAEALLIYVEDDVRVPLRCAVAGLEAEAGVARVRRLVVDTKDSIVRGQGSIDLGRETLDLRLEAQGKDISPLDPDAPIFIQGSFADPTVSIGTRGLIPLVGLGLAGNAPCERLIREVMARGEEGPRSAAASEADRKREGDQ